MKLYFTKHIWIPLDSGIQDWIKLAHHNAIKKRDKFNKTKLNT